jgi:hypothetical protein
MNCREIQKRLAEAGQAAPGDLRVKEHLEKCPDCQGVLKGIEAVDRALIDLEGVTPPKNVVERTLAAVDQRKVKPRSSLRLALAIASPVVLVLVVGIFGTTFMKSGMEQARAPGTAGVSDRPVEMTAVGDTHSGHAYWVGDRTEAENGAGRLTATSKPAGVKISGAIGGLDADSTTVSFESKNEREGWYNLNELQGAEEADEEEGEEYGLRWKAEELMRWWGDAAKTEAYYQKAGALEQKAENLKDRVFRTKAHLALLKVPTMGPEVADNKEVAKKEKPLISPVTVDNENEIDKLGKDARDLQRRSSVRNPGAFLEVQELEKDISKLREGKKRIKDKESWLGEDSGKRSADGLVVDDSSSSVRGPAGEERLKIQSGETTQIKMTFEEVDLDRLAFIPARGYFKNTYLPGDPELVFLREKLEKGLFMDGEALRLERASLPYRQPFDAPSSSGISVYLNADRTFVEGKSRITLQVGLKGSLRHARRRASLNAALLVDLRSVPSEGGRRALWALADSMVQSLQAGDRFALVVAGVKKPLRVKSARFSLSSVRVALALALEEIEASGVKGTLEDAIEAAYQAVGGEETDDAPIGANLVLLASAAQISGDTDALQLDAHLRAVSGITLSTIGVGEHADMTDLDALAFAGQGRRRMVAGAKAARPVVEEELAATGSVVARAVRLRIRLAKGVKLVEVLGSHPLTVERSERVRQMEKAIDKKVAKNLGIAADRGEDEDGIQIVIPAYYAGDDHVILLDVVVEGPGKIADVRVRYKDLVNLKNAVARAELTLRAGRKPDDLLVCNVRKNLLAYRMSADLHQAARSLQEGRIDGARDVLARASARIERMQARYPELADDPEVTRDAGMLAEYLQVLGDYSVWQGNRAVQVHLVRSLAYSAKVKLPPGQSR